MDSEFLEGTQEKRMFGIKYGQTKPTIDLISIALVAEDGREFYSISKDFNLKEAWNRYDLKVEKMYGDARNIFPDGRKYKEYWIRENVLKPIFEELFEEYVYADDYKGSVDMKFEYDNLKFLINKYGKTNKQIAEEIKEFTNPVQNMDKNIPDYMQVPEQFKTDYSKPQFYGYYSAYDHVVFCWLFGKMIDLPKGFPMYCNDLKQTFDERVNSIIGTEFITFNTLQFEGKKTSSRNFHDYEKLLKNHSKYPKQTNSHNALADARWNKQLHEFLKTL